MKRCAGAIAALALVVAGCGKHGAAPDAAPQTCTVSTDCDADEWCNPGGNVCEPRASTLQFDRDVYPEIQTRCQQCHLPGGVGTSDSLGTGVPALFTDPATTYATLVAGGTDCHGTPHRLCVDEPKDSNALVRLLPGSGQHDQAVELPDGYRDPWAQTVMQWIAAGAQRPGDGHPDAGVVDGGVDGAVDAGAVDATPCDGSKLPTEDPCVIDDAFGVFVAPAASGGSDTGDGTRASPYATFGHAIDVAIAAGKRVYACGGTYAESVTIDSSRDGIAIFGGLRCSDWQVDPTAKPDLTGGAAQAATIVIAGLTKGAVLSDLRVEHGDAATAGASAIAMLVDASANVELVRCDLVAGKGAAGSAGSTAYGWRGVNGVAGIAACACDPSMQDCSACDPIIDPDCPSDGAKLCNGIDVSGGTPGFYGTNWGSPVDMSGMSGGWPGANADCSYYSGQVSCGAGQDGAPGTSAAATRNGGVGMGTLSSSGWLGAAGGVGADGTPGQGGGSGGDGTLREGFNCDDTVTCWDGYSPTLPVGGGGGSGGCGGTGGGGGTTGGASFALAVVDLPATSTLDVRGCTLTASAGGKGGDGGKGAAGEAGGRGGPAGRGAGVYYYETSSCAGGNGGRGGDGGPGGGGSGGHSAAIAFYGKAPSVDGTTTFAHGTAGTGGLDGSGGVVGVGADGVAADTLNVGAVDTTPPTGGGVTGVTATPCSQITVTIAPANDDTTPAASIEHEICWSETPGACASSWTRLASTYGTAPYATTMVAEQGKTLYFSSRARDLAGNLAALTPEMSVSVPVSLTWQAGAVTATPVAGTPRRFSVDWPAVTTACTTATVSVQLCVGGSCNSVATTGPVQVGTSTCASTTFLVKVTDGLVSDQRSVDAAWPVAFATVQNAYNTGGMNACAYCHGAGKSFPNVTLTTADVNAADTPVCPSFEKIAPGDPSYSDIFRVASSHQHVCGGTHTGGAMSASDVNQLGCWIEQGAP